MGVFGAVKVTTGRPDRDNGIVPVVVDVREAPFHTIRYGGGIGLDPVRQEYRLIAEYTDRNFLGDLRKLTLRGKVGWAFLPALWNIDQQAPIFDFYAEFEQPRFPGRDFKWLSSVDFYKNIEQAYGYIGVRAKTGIVWQPHSSFRIYPSYNIEVDRITGVTNGLSGSAPQLAYGCNLTPGGPGLLPDPLVPGAAHRVGPARRQARAAQWVVRSHSPSSGAADSSAEITRTGGSSRTCARTSRGVLSPSQASSGSARCSPVRPARSLHASSPEEEPSIAASAVASSRLSSRCPTTMPLPTNPLVGTIGTPQLNGTYVPVGGDGIWDSSIELRYKIIGPLTVAVFLDAGFVTVGSFDFRDVGPMMQYAIGFGFRYNTIVGPIRLDFAYRLNHGGPLPIITDPAHPVYAPGGTECFGIGTGSPTYAGFPAGRCALTISIGEAY